MSSSIGDLSTKLATQGRARLAFILTVAVGYVVGTGLLQLAYQRGETLTETGIGTLFTTRFRSSPASCCSPSPSPAAS